MAGHFAGKAMPLTHMIRNAIAILFLLVAAAQVAAAEKADSVYRPTDKAMAGADAVFARRGGGTAAPAVPSSWAMTAACLVSARPATA